MSARVARKKCAGWITNDQERDINEINESLYVACNSGHFDVVKLLLSVSNIDVNQSLADGQSPLFGAAENGHSSIIKLLLKVHPYDHVHPVAVQ